ncbi:MAG: UbiX family flavin prenyltransferase [Treponema sp.]|jgi:4-hydroxy-3-polyprenylbenzoate decarboxylase|nr:UbiX family flavin prenyltransferase [Treponema sp.]
MKKYLVCMTGASGAVYGIRVMRALVESGCEVHAIVSRWGERVVMEETGRAFAAWADTVGVAREHIYDADDLAAPTASGSFRLDGAVIVPCSMNSVGAIASGVCGNLIHRAGLVCLKERRPLILVPRECPFSLIDLKNMTTLATAGATILPASPSFYHKPKTIDDLIDFIAGKILDCLGIEHALFKRWHTLRVF